MIYPGFTVATRSVQAANGMPLQDAERPPIGGCFAARRTRQKGGRSWLPAVGKAWGLALLVVLGPLGLGPLGLGPQAACFADDEKSSNVKALPKLARTNWMLRHPVGVSTHYVARREKLAEMAEAFDAEKVSQQVVATGAGWFLFTLQHQPWTTMAPNSALDRIVGSGDYTSERDIPLELADGLADERPRLMLYVNVRLDPDSSCPPSIRKAMGGWPPSNKVISNMASVYREFSLRYGESVAGWWVDGAWHKDYKGSPRREAWFGDLADALRAGNPNAVVAFNPGVIRDGKLKRYSRHDDYTAGEADEIGVLPRGKRTGGAQSHLWTYVGGFWGLSGLRHGNREVTEYARQVVKRQGALTLEVGTIGRAERGAAPGSDTRSAIGAIDPRQVNQVGLVIRSLRRDRAIPKR